jgi:hypothetical protein
VGFSAFRDGDVDASRRRKARKKSIGNIGGALNDDSDEEDDDESALLDKMKDIDEKDGSASLGPEDVRSQGELADGLDRIRVCHCAGSPCFLMANRFLRSIAEKDPFCRSASIPDRDYLYYTRYRGQQRGKDDENVKCIWR